MNENKVRIYWADAVIYKQETRGKFDLKPTKMITEGFVLKEVKEGVYLKDPSSIYEETGKTVEKHAGSTFFFIPRGMIVKIEEIK